MYDNLLLEMFNDLKKSEILSERLYEFLRNIAENLDSYFVKCNSRKCDVDVFLGVERETTYSVFLNEMPTVPLFEFIYQDSKCVLFVYDDVLVAERQDDFDLFKTFLTNNNLVNYSSYKVLDNSNFSNKVLVSCDVSPEGNLVERKEFILKQNDYKTWFKEYLDFYVSKLYIDYVLVSNKDYRELIGHDLLVRIDDSPVDSEVLMWT